MEFTLFCTHRRHIERGGGVVTKYNSTWSRIANTKPYIIYFLLFFFCKLHSQNNKIFFFFQDSWFSEMRKLSIGSWSGVTWTSHIQTTFSHQYLIVVLLLILLPIDLVCANNVQEPLNRSSITIIKVGARATNSGQNDKVCLCCWNIFIFNFVVCKIR